MLALQRRSLVASLALASAASFLAQNASAQVAALVRRDVGADLDTGWVSNPTAFEQVTGWFVADVPAAAWLRLAFGDVALDGDPLVGPATKVRVTSLLDLGMQILDARTLEQWRRTSAYFNGGAVLVEIVAPPFAGPSRVTVAAITSGGTAGPGTDALATLCGASDDREPSSDPRIARVLPVGCTAWTIDDCNRCMLTAGHCVTPSLEVVEFDVPASTATGEIQHPPPSEQYAVDPASVRESLSGSPGDDWGYFGVFPNSTTGLTPFEAQGQAFALAAAPPFVPGDGVRVTGHGADDTPPERNQVQQTHSGPWTSSSGSLLEYEVDTMPGSSGSPVVHAQTGIAIAIHASGGCSNVPGSSNSGTSLAQASLLAALASPSGVCAPGIEPQGVLPALLVPATPTLVRARISAAIVPQSATLHSRPDASSAFTAYPLHDVGGGVFEGHLPPFECGDAPAFYFAALSTTCGTITSPPTAPAGTFTALVGGLEPSFADDFQTSRGWVATAGPGLTSGHWQRGVPVANAQGAPSADSDGSGACYLTQNAVQNSDVDDGTAFLTSPVFDLAGGARIAYRYWLGSTGALGSGDGLRVEVSTDPAGAAWTTLRSYTAVANAWRDDALAIGTEIGATSTVRVRFAATDVPPGHLVEAALDAFVIERLACAASGAAFCAGDGTATACPCGNVGGAGRGCGNSANASGARLRAFGTPSLQDDGLTLAGDGLPATTNALFFQGDAQVAAGAGVTFGDGLRCAGGAVLRLATRSTTGGAIALGAGIAGDPRISIAGAVPSGGATRLYQLWYRNSAPFCTSSPFNTSNGVSVVWGP